MIRKIVPVIVFIANVITVFAQGTLEDYQRSKKFRAALSDALYYIPTNIKWNKKGDAFLYEQRTSEGKEFVWVDANARKKEQLFDNKALADQLEKASGQKVDINSLNGYSIKLLGKDTVEFAYNNALWQWNRSSSSLKKVRDVEENQRSGGYWGQRRDDTQGRPVTSPDKKKTAYIKNHNLYYALVDDPKSEKQLTFDGSPGEYYSAHILWSPDSKKIVGVRTTKQDVRILTLLESSPTDQLQPKLQTRHYAKPGDALPQYYPAICNIETNKVFVADKQLIDNQFSIGALSWREDSKSIVFEFNKRGHQQYAVVKLDAENGQTKYIINEVSNTFIDYSGKKYRYDVNDGKEIIWASERDGWNHLYRIDGETGQVLNQITKGDWVVRKVVHVDEKNRQIIFEGSGRIKNQDPYLIHYYKIDFDGKNLKELTKEEANHTAYFNEDYSYFVDQYSLINKAPVTVLRDHSGKIVMELEKGDESKLFESGWKAAEVFTSKSRDNKYDIWGIIVRPTNFDPSKKYPVIEYIYAGPHSSFVPKTFNANPSGMQELAELGFIVVQIDGMGTSNRSKEFHNVAWKNLKDAGFPDRIKWIKAAAQKYPYMDIDRVGIYGTSAGGQSSTGGVLFHPEFYKVAVSSCGCHDNRMDKIWWNEQWMGWPVGPEYAECSNVENAYRLQGKLMLIVGEVDDNVDPSSTYQLTNALIKANKDHELILVPGMGHSSGGDYGERKRRDFFVKHLHGVDPPAWNTY
jgi:dipeptidyl aminopeptidase/acylaminoacyl peptidase